MAKKGFEREQVLDNAIQLFWQHGYTASSVQQITRYTGLKPGSLYHEFGNKEGLFKAALSRYSERSLSAIHQTMKEADTVVAGIRNVLSALINETVGTDYCGCFLIKTQLELAAQDNALYQLASERLAETEATYRQYLEQQYDAQQATAYAKQVMIAIFGIRVYGYQRRGVEEMQDIVRGLLPWVYH